MTTYQPQCSVHGARACKHPIDDDNQAFKINYDVEIAIEKQTFNSKTTSLIFIYFIY